MPFSDAVLMAKNFRRYPPVHVALAVQAGYRPEDPEERTAFTVDDARAMRGAIRE